MASNPNNPNILKHPQTTYRLNASQVASSPSLIVPSSQQPVACWLAKAFGNAAISEASSLVTAKNGRNLTNRRDKMGWTMINPWIFFGSMMINDPCRSHPELKSQRSQRSGTMHQPPIMLSSTPAEWQPLAIDMFRSRLCLWSGGSLGKQGSKSGGAMGVLL